MNSNDAVINPIKGKNSPDPGPVVIMVSSNKDMQSICNLLNVKPDDSSELMMSRMCTVEDKQHRFSIVGPIIGAPYAAILLENLIAWGAEKILFFGLCGAISPDVKIGDVVLSRGSFIDEGTSLHYGGKIGETSFCSHDILFSIKSLLIESQLSFHEGLVWTTDAVFRETFKKVKAYQKKQVLAVEMETSALFTIGRYRKVDVGAILVVSDELSTFTWKPGFGKGPFKQQCRAIQRIITKLCLTLQMESNNL